METSLWLDFLTTVFLTKSSETEITCRIWYQMDFSIDLCFAFDDEIVYFFLQFVFFLQNNKVGKILNFQTEFLNKRYWSLWNISKLVSILEHVFLKPS